MHEKLGLKEVIERWVPRMLTIDQVTEKTNVLIFNRDPREFKRKSITVDETKRVVEGIKYRYIKCINVRKNNS